MMWLSVLPIGRLAGMCPLIASVCRNRRPLALSASWRASGIPSAMGPLAWLTMSSRKRLAWRALRAISEMPFLLLSSSSRVMIGRKTSCSSKRNRLVGSCIRTLVSRTKSFVADCDLVRREGTDLRGASAAKPVCCSDCFNKIEHLLGVTGDLDSAPFAPEDAVAVEHESAPLDPPHLFAVHVLHLHDPELAADFLGLVRKQLEGKSHLGLEILVRLETVARDSGYRTSRLLELGVEIAKLRAFRGAARSVVLGVEIQDQQPGFERREPELLAAGGGQHEVAHCFVGHPESAPLGAIVARIQKRTQPGYFGRLMKEILQAPPTIPWALPPGCSGRNPGPVPGRSRPARPSPRAERSSALSFRACPRERAAARRACVRGRPRRARDRSIRPRGNPRSSRGSPPDRGNIAGTRRAPRARTPSSPRGACRCGSRGRNPDWRRSAFRGSAPAAAGRTSGNRPWRTRGIRLRTSCAWERCRARRAFPLERDGPAPFDARPALRGRGRPRKTLHDPGFASPPPGPGPWRAWNNWHGRAARGVFRCLRNRAGPRPPR